MAQRAHGELLGVHVRTADGLAGPRSENLAAPPQLLADLGGEYHEVVASDVAAALAEFARAENCTQLVLGASRRSRWSELVRGLGDQPRGPARRPDRRARHLARPDRGRAAAPVAPAPLRLGDRRCPAAARSSLGCSRRSGLPLLTLAARPGPRRHRPGNGAAAVPARSSSRSARSAAIVPGVAAAVRRLPARQLLLHAADPSRGRSRKARTCSRSSCSSW